MLGIIKELILAEVKIDPKIVLQICNQALPVANYGSVYKLTYNQCEPKVEDLIEFIQEHSLTNNKQVMEIMAGNGFETKHIATRFPNNTYICSDIIDYFEPLEGLIYQKIDCTNTNYKHVVQQDLIFIGGANASMCMLKSLKEVLRLSAFLQTNIKLGGFAVLSYFEENYTSTNFSIDYSVDQIKNYHQEQYNGLYTHWFSAVKYDVETQLHHYYDLAAVTADDELSPSSKYLEIVYNKEPFIARSWQTAIVMEIMKQAGFEYIGNKWNMDQRFMPFKKVTDVNDWESLLC